jgi:D-glycero-beta-D-manno-heptose 1-phosphate adenylyltransferase
MPTHEQEPLVGQLALALPRPLVFSHGVFDLLHAGHVECLEHARALGASLVVGVHSDASARRLGKGPGRPLNRERDRLRVVEALAAVSTAVLFDEDAPLTLVQRLRPDVVVTGGSPAPQTLPFAALLTTWGGRTVIVPRRMPLSTRTLIDRAAHAFAAAETA